ncbi:MAG: extensin family protein [Rhodobacteraceae bacterium]|nr:extensin family protein [Paracoccaceae bacterium]
MRALRHLALCLALMPAFALAQAPDSSIFPRARPSFDAAAVPVAAAVAVPHPKARPAGLAAPVVSAAAAPAVAGAAVPHPKPRPAGLASQPAPVAVAAVPADPRVVGPHPKARPAGLAVELASAATAPVPEAAVVAPAKPSKKAKAGKKGSVCGDPAIRGEVLAPITSKTRGCGISEPVRVTAIDGVQFSQPATIDCATAIAFKKWIVKGMRPAFGNREVVGLHIFGSYMCRSRNNIRGAKISEHGRGKAVDVAGFVFSDGREWTVADDYNKQIRKAQKAACGIFGTTLGPGSDGYHEDHLHFDTASYRNGAYCR